MSLWPKYGPSVPPIIGPWYSEPFTRWHNNLAFANAGTRGPAQNRCNFWPVELPEPCTITKLFWMNGGTVNGNVDVGVYTGDGKLIIATGSTVMAGANAKQEVDIADTPLPPGYLLFAFVTNSATATFFGVDNNPWDFMTTAWTFGIKQQTGTFPLPATATLANCSNMGLLKFGALVAPRTIV